jgi:hypothetical protein
MPNLNEFEEAERRRISEHELFNSEDDEIMPKAEKKARTATRETPYQREKARLEKEKAEQAEKTRVQNNSRAARAARRAGQMEGVEATPQPPVEPAPQARETALQANAADEARRMEAALQEQIARDNAVRDERRASTAPGSEMDHDADIAAQFAADLAAADVRAREAQRSSPDIDEHAIQEELDRQLQETAASDATQAQARADNIRLRELEAENQALRKAAETANQERLEAVSGRMAETTRADDATAESQQLAKQLSQSNFEREFAVKHARDLEAGNAELTARQSELERQSDTTIAMGKTSIEAANRARQEADARASRLEGDNRVLRRERDEAVKTVGERDQQLAQAGARNEALARSQAAAKQASDLRIADLERRNLELVRTATQADLSATTEKANREATERELVKRDGELRTNKESLAAEKAARQQADARAGDLDDKLKAANEAAAREKAGREAAEREAASQKKLVGELSGEGDKAKALETARRDAETKAKDLESKLQSAIEEAAREKVGREAAEREAASQKKLVGELSGEGNKARALETARRDAEAKAKGLESKLQSATEEAQREKAAREASEKNAQDLIAKNDQLTTQAKEATQALVQTEERLKTMRDHDGDSELRKQLEQEKDARQAAEAKLAATTERMIDQSKAAATARRNETQQAARDAERIVRLEAELKTARETPDPDKPIPSVEKDETGKNTSRAATAAKDDEFGLDDISDADFDAAVAAAEAKQKQAAAAKAKDDEFGLDDISVADFDAAVAAAETSRRTPAPASREGSPALDPAHTVKGNVWYRAGKMYVPEAQYDKMLKAGVRVPLEADKSAREVLLQTPNGDLHSPKAYKSAHGAAAFEARAKAEGLDPKIAAKWAAKDQTRPEVLVRLKNGNLVDGKSLEIAAGKAGLAGKFGEKNVFIENQTTKIEDGREIKNGTGNYRRADNAIEHARAAGSTVKLNQRLDTIRVSPQPEGRASRSATPASNLSTNRNASPSTRGTTPERAAPPAQQRKPIFRNGKVVASVPVNGNNGGVKRLNQRPATAQPRQNVQGDNRYDRGGSQPPAPGYQRPDQGGAHNRQTSPTTTINLTVNGAVGHGTATPNVAANAKPQTKYSTKLDERTTDPHSLS